MAKAFASTEDLAEKTRSFTEVGRDLYAFTAEGDPNTGVIIGDEFVMVVDTQATPVMAQRVIDEIRKVTDKPIKYVVLSHYHAVRVLGAAAYRASEIVASSKCQAMIHERGQDDWDSEYGRFPRLFRAADSIPGLTWPTMTFETRMTVNMGRRRVELFHPGRAHTAGDTVVWIPDAGVMFSGDIVESSAACYCGDGHFKDWVKTLEVLKAYRPAAIVPGRGDAVMGAQAVQAAIESTQEFIDSTYSAVAPVASRGGSLREAWDACRAACDPKFASYAIYEHCLPFNVARAYDEAVGIETPRVWTAARDRDLWESLQGAG